MSEINTCSKRNPSHTTLLKLIGLLKKLVSTASLHLDPPPRADESSLTPRRDHFQSDQDPEVSERNPHRDHQLRGRTDFPSCTRVERDGKVEKSTCKEGSPKVGILFSSKTKLHRPGPSSNELGELMLSVVLKRECIIYICV